MEDPEVLVLLSPHLEILDLQIQEAKNLPALSPRSPDMESQDLEFQDLQAQNPVLEVLMTQDQEVEALPEVMHFVLYIFNFYISRNNFPLLH